MPDSCFIQALYAISCPKSAYFLAKKPGVFSPTNSSQDGLTPLHFAACNGHLEVAVWSFQMAWILDSMIFGFLSGSDLGRMSKKMTILYRTYMDVSKNWFYHPNHPIFIGFFIINHPFWGPTPIFGNTHIMTYIFTETTSQLMWLANLSKLFDEISLYGSS